MPIWDPQEVLDLYNSPKSSTCSGTTKRGFRCKQSMISDASRSNAVAIMQLMSLIEPSTIDPDVYRHLARLTLCPRWHLKPGYSQVSSVSQRFERQVKTYCSQQQASTAQMDASTTSIPQGLTNGGMSLVEDGLLPAASTAQQRPLPAIPSETPESSQTGTESDSAAPSSSTSLSPSSLVQPSPRQQPTPPSSTPSSRRSSDASVSNTISRTQTTPVQPQARIQPHPGTSPTSSASSPISSTPVSPPASPRLDSSERPLPPTPSSPDATTTSHSCVDLQSASRKPIDDPCPVCYEPLTLDTSVYCRRQCGTNVHRDCFQEWRLHQLKTWDKKNRLHGNESPQQLLVRAKNRDAAVKCVYCRSQWD